MKIIVQITAMTGFFGWSIHCRAGDKQLSRGVFSTKAAAERAGRAWADEVFGRGNWTREK